MLITLNPRRAEYQRRCPPLARRPTIGDPTGHRGESMPTTTTDAKDLFREVVDALNDRDFDRFAAPHAEDVVLHDHDETITGVADAIEHEQAIYEAFPDTQTNLDSVIAEGQTVAGRWTVTGTHEGEFEGLPPTGEEIEIPAAGEMRIENGEIAEVWLVYDRLGLMQQLGAVEAD